ncbi:MAG: adenosylcobalamin-dependent ribonucleoside-diphosphate reductase [Nanoarchaeota archaeon]
MVSEKKGLTIERYFTKPGQKPEDSFPMDTYDIDIKDENNIKLFSQRAEFPTKWSQLAREIVASRYFYGDQDTPQRENSIKNVVERVSSTMAEWAVRQGYFPSQEVAQLFQDELAYTTYSQKMAFNSPVWFNVGVHKKVPENFKKHQSKSWRIAEKDDTIKLTTSFGEIPVTIKKGDAIPLQEGEEYFYPQTSACFIQSLEDTMESIMDLAVKEAMLFKYGSGTGTNLSTLRSSKEKLSGGGKPSGPLAYWSFLDKVAAIVKSGGKTRRAAKMHSLDDCHPDILEFINAKRDEEELLHLLIDNGIPYSKAQESINYQNTNVSVMAGDAFMQAVIEDKDWQTIPVHNKEMADKMPKYKAKNLIRRIAENTHFCGDPGMQFRDTINRWHTCKNSGDIHASNPCSEYLFLDDSACNLASLKLIAFLLKNGEFDTTSFEYTIGLTATVQDLLIDASSFPTKKIAENSHKYRPIGMGYADLGSLIMSLGLPYDSDEARAIAASITALMTGKVYETSTELAEHLGTFEEFQKNKEPMLEVMKMHREALKKIEKDKLPKGFEKVLTEAERVWDSVLERGEKYGFRNAQATVLAPTGTIGFMMDCDTKGIEPEIGLVQTKILAEGGILRLVNGTVEPTLQHLGYSEVQISEIKKYVSGNGSKGAPYLKQEELEEINKKPFELKKILKEKKYSEKQIEEIDFYINGHETMEGAPYIQEEHLPIFDCSNKPKGGNRTISPQGHLKMMAAVQPFLSGAISKTVNLPEEATIEEIEKTYIEAWQMGIKAVALYRDNSKRQQPLNFSKRGKLEEKVQSVRRKLPATRDAKIHKFTIGGYGENGHEGYLMAGVYPDGTLGETFVDMNKEGSTIRGLMASLGISLSLNLQYGVPLEKLIEKFRHQKFEPNGIVQGHPQIHTADSIVDYLAHFLELQFLPNGNGKKVNDPEEPKNDDLTKSPEQNDEEENSEPAGGFCAECGTQMRKKGHCLEKCPKCGWENTKGCGA